VESIERFQMRIAFITAATISRIFEESDFERTSPSAGFFLPKKSLLQQGGVHFETETSLMLRDCRKIRTMENVRLTENISAIVPSTKFCVIKSLSRIYLKLSLKYITLDLSTLLKLGLSFTS
jgi:hypothetical protein